MRRLLIQGALALLVCGWARAATISFPAPSAQLALPTLVELRSDAGAFGAASGRQWQTALEQHVYVWEPGVAGSAIDREGGRSVIAAGFPQWELDLLESTRSVEIDLSEVFSKVPSLNDRSFASSAPRSHDQMAGRAASGPTARSGFLQWQLQAPPRETWVVPAVEQAASQRPEGKTISPALVAAGIVVVLVFAFLASLREER